MIGKTLVHYEITAEIGKGGMGEVYQAKDTKLGRDVAIKVLPEEFATDSDRVTRFRREAKLLASLNHPNIAAIYGLEESEGMHFLVMELIEGETLKDRIKSGPIPVEEALKLALQMAEALEAAHENGVIHRDLKPANIKITPDGKVKVLDFGLAKAYAGDSEKMDPADSPTLSAAATQQGVILGTAAYMSPEQARGKLVDRRADIWAFGCVLYEMLTGEKAFTGGDVTDTLAAVLRSEPEWDSLPANLHWRVKEVLERCLEKKARDRYGSISDARVDIQKALADPSGLFVQPSAITKPRKRVQLGLPLVATIAIVCIIIAALAVWMLKPAEPRQVIRLSHDLSSGQQLSKPSGAPALAVSPDGKQFVYTTPDGLYLRSVDELNAKLIAGTEGNPLMPFFSPDGKWIGYSAGGTQLKKISVNGGAPVVLCETDIFAAADWHENNTIVYAQFSGDIMRVSGDGGTPESIVKRPGLVAFPQFLPSGKAIIYTDFSVQTARIMAHSLESGDSKELFPGTHAMYLPTGHLVYSLANNNVFAVPFDLDKLAVTGGPVPLQEGVLEFTLSNSGTLVYVSGTSVSGSASPRTLVWVDKKGNEEQIDVEPDMFQFPTISPDGTKVALSVERDGNMDIWIWDLIRENLSRLTFDEAADQTPMWTPDGKRIVFASGRDGNSCIFWKAADGTGEVEKLGSVPGQRLFPWSWSSDGKTLVTAEISGPIGVDIGAISMEGNGERKLLLKSDYAESHPRISPDGRWMAYFSSETGDNHIFVRPFPEVDQGKWQVSVDGGQSPLWSPDGRELYYLNGDAIMVAQVNTEPTFNPGKPKTLFRGNYVTGYQENPEWDISPDGKRFIMIKPGADPDDETTTESPRKINIVLNWDEELKQRVPVE